jgi:hypothetical protein
MKMGISDENLRISLLKLMRAKTNSAHHLCRYGSAPDLQQSGTPAGTEVVVPAGVQSFRDRF